ncbi:hypothetical protein L9F63_011766, partial [Diploptera punctata]
VSWNDLLYVEAVELKLSFRDPVIGYGDLHRRLHRQNPNIKHQPIAPQPPALQRSLSLGSDYTWPESPTSPTSPVFQKPSDWLKYSPFQSSNTHEVTTSQMINKPSNMLHDWNRQTSSTSNNNSVPKTSGYKSARTLRQHFESVNQNASEQNVRTGYTPSSMNNKIKERFENSGTGTAFQKFEKDISESEIKYEPLNDSNNDTVQFHKQFSTNSNNCNDSIATQNNHRRISPTTNNIGYQQENKSQRQEIKYRNITDNLMGYQGHQQFTLTNKLNMHLSAGAANMRSQYAPLGPVRSRSGTPTDSHENEIQYRQSGTPTFQENNSPSRKPVFAGQRIRVLRHPASTNFTEFQIFMNNINCRLNASDILRDCCC